MRLQPFQTSTELAVASRGTRQTGVPADAGFAPGHDDLRIGAIFRLPAIWWRRAHFRAKLRADLSDRSDFLRDVGISMYEARVEGARYFWEPIKLKRR
jgi:uncharacterized protein YjiS (DUF1127 family)